MVGNSSKSLKKKKQTKQGWKGSEEAIRSISVPSRQDFVCVTADRSLSNQFLENFSDSAVFPSPVDFQKITAFEKSAQ